MELDVALRSTGAIREFTDEPVDDAVLWRILDAARFAPSGGNKQAWGVIVVKDPELRAGVRDLWLAGWHEYLAVSAAGLRPWAPITDRVAEAEGIEAGRVAMAEGLPAGEFAEHFDEVPAMLVVTADLRLLAAVDRDLDRYSLAGGASVYPFVWSILLAAHGEGLGGVLTTMAVVREPALRSLLGIPEEFAVAAVLAMGHPVRRPTKLTRNPVDGFATLDRFDGPALPPG